MWNFVFFARRQSRVRVYLFFFSQGSSYRPSVLECCKRAHSNEMKSASALFKWPKNWRAPRPPPTLIFFPKSTDQNFEIPILFRIIENHNNYVFGDDLSPTVPGGGAARHKLWPMFTYSNGYWEVYRRYQGDFFGLGVEFRGGGYMGGSFLGGVFHGEEKFNEKGAGLSFRKKSPFLEQKLPYINSQKKITWQLKNH